MMKKFFIIAALFSLEKAQAVKIKLLNYGVDISHPSDSTLKSTVTINVKCRVDEDNDLKRHNLIEYLEENEECIYEKNKVVWAHNNVKSVDLLVPPINHKTTTELNVPIEEMSFYFGFNGKIIMPGFGHYVIDKDIKKIILNLHQNESDPKHGYPTLNVIMQR